MSKTLKVLLFQLSERALLFDVVAPIALVGSGQGQYVLQMR
jgi:hypothetical protein